MVIGPAILCEIVDAPELGREQAAGVWCQCRHRSQCRTGIEGGIQLLDDTAVVRRRTDIAARASHSGRISRSNVRFQL